MENILQYPIGKYVPEPYSDEKRQQWLTDISFLPNVIESAIHNLDEGQLQTPYRDGGWTVHQLVHHIADSHMNAYIRFKLGFTEQTPTIKTYEEKRWAETEDVKQLPVNVSVTLLFALHQRWSVFLEQLSESDLQRTMYHPEQKKEITLWHLLGMYSWHGRHHAAHINGLRQRMGW